MITACAVIGGGDSTTDPSQNNTPSTTLDLGGEDGSVRDDVPELDYFGETLTVMARVREWFEDEILVPDENGTVINDSVYKRNEMVKERLGIELELEGVTGTDNYSINNSLQNLIQSGAQNIDLISCAAYSTASTTADGLYLDLREIEYLDLTKPYWSQGLNDAMEIGGRQYICSGAALLSYYRLIFVTFFNIDMFNDAGAEMLYDTVEKNEWTISKQIELVNLFYKDDNGNGESDDGDIFGFMSNHNMIGVDPYWATCELPILQRDSDGFYKLAINKERTVEVIDQLRELFWECEGTLRFKKETGDVEQDAIAQQFAAQKAAMVSLRLIEVENDLLDMDNYGIVPIAKLNSDQKGYRSSIHDTFSVFAIPSFSFSDERLSRIGAFLEVMASESFNITTVTYYEQALKGRYVNDPQSVTMLDIITQNVNIDAGVLYSNALSKPQYIIRDTVGGNLSNAASVMKMKEKIFEKNLEALNKSFEELING